MQFQDFKTSCPTDKLYVNVAQAITVNCAGGGTSVVQIPAGIVGYVLKFAIGSAPYPDLTINCTGGPITIPVPPTVTQAQLDALVNGMLNQCVQQIAQGLGCPEGIFFNTAQTLNACPSTSPTISTTSGALPPGVSVVNNLLTMAAGVIQSTISVSDANGKAQQVLQEVFLTGNAQCIGGD